MTTILVLFYSKHGTTRLLAEHIVLGIESVGAVAKLRTVAPISDQIEKTRDDIPSSGYAYANLDDLTSCDGLIYGSPTHFGNMAGAMKYFWDNTSSVWLKGSLIGKPASVFTSSSSLHGGQESTLLSMMLPLLHQGMMIMGIPYSEAALHTTSSGGTPYGVTSVHKHGQKLGLSKEEKELAFAQGKRLAQVVQKLQGSNR